ncbi:MAG: protein-L-isoaspartate(D-aspartate) O-methyltransferase [Candidatus Pacebacteria bacterium]|nr:protein-L-isoaspartate(D-aspartate) O-methyltransferase [Candidatus Paceibacterota bacterium]
MKLLTEDLISRGYLKTPRTIDAFYKIDRVDFVPEELKSEAYVNEPLPIGYGQTISQPLTVAFMLELLAPEEGEKILDVGSGSGWQSSMLAYIAGDKGKVFAIERISELSEFGRKNSEKYNFKNLKFIIGDGSKGYGKEAFYDRIIVAASAFSEIPEELKKQLKIGGRLVIPVENSIWLVVKKAEDEYEEKEFPGFAFVPLISE